MSVDIPATFVSTYYRRLYRDPSDMRKFYNSFSLLTRSTPGRNRKCELSEASDSDVVPFNPKVTTTRIYTYNAKTFPDGIVVTVYGALSGGTEGRFSQEFVLIEQASRWFVISDSFFAFEGSRTDLVGCEGPQERLLPQPQPQKRSRAEDFDPTRTVTVINLSNNYKGDDLCKEFERFGHITGRFYTYNTVYIEFETPEIAGAAATPPCPMYQGSYTQVVKGIVPVQPRPGGRRAHWRK